MTSVRLVVLTLHAGLLLTLPLLGGLLGVLVALPLLLPLRGLWAGRPYTYAWCSLLIVFYAGAFLAEAWSHPQRATAAIALAFVAAAEFWGLLLYVRLRARARPPV